MARPIIWFKPAGCHGGSKIITFLVPFRSRPSAPADVKIKASISREIQHYLDLNLRGGPCDPNAIRENVYMMTDRIDVNNITKRVCNFSVFLATGFVTRLLIFRELCNIWNIPFSLHMVLLENWEHHIVPMQIISLILNLCYKYKCLQNESKTFSPISV